MAIMRWDPMRDFGSLQDRINRLFEETLRGFSAGDREDLEKGMWAPAVDIYETEDSYVVSADLPGMNKEDIQIDLRDSTLTIKGEKKFVEEVKRDHYVRIERAYGTFVRSFTLPQTVDADGIKANYKDGVLTLTLPKTEQAKPKQIKIN
jgi:HSP20 family protein